MKKTILLLAIFILPFYVIHSQEQKDDEWAMQNAREAIRLMDDGFHDKSIELLKESIEINPDKIFYWYELGLAYYKKEDFKEAVKTFKKISKHKDIFDQVYQMLGNAYDINGQRDKAIETYEKGMKEFPNSGLCYLERSIIHMSENEFNEAVATLEQGVSADPMYSSCYYWLAKLFLEYTEEEVWGMIYGELFMHLEPNTHRSQEISRLLYNTYKNEITFNGDSSKVSFSKTKNINIQLSEKDMDNPENMIKLLQKAMKQSFGSGVYEPTLILSLIGKEEINLATLNEIRSHFIDLYMKEEYEDFPIVLFDFQKKIKDAGHFEAYNYWLLLYGNEEEFDTWLSDEENTEKLRQYTQWYNENLEKLVINQENKFLRDQ